MDSPVPGTSQRCSSRLSLSQKFAKSAYKTRSRCSVKTNTPPPSSAHSEEDSKELMQLLSNDPFRLTNLTLAEEDDLISRAPDAVTLSSKESENDVGLKCRRNTSPASVVSISSGSDRVTSPTPKKSTMTEFFTPLKSRRNSMSSGMGVSTLKSTTQKTSSRKENFSKTDPKKTSKVRKQICKSTNIKMLTNKYFDDSQKRIPNFFIKHDDPDRVGYHRVLKSSVMPAINTGDENIEQFLMVDIDEGNEPLRPSQFQGPMMSPIPDDPDKILERIEKVQSACYDPEKDDWNMEVTDVAVVVQKNPDEVVDSGYSNDGPSTVIVQGIVRNPKTPAPKRKSTAKKQSTVKKVPAAKTPATCKRKAICCPKYKIIAGTTFAVDAFRYGDIEGVSHYFLTHFHADHYIGLKRRFAMPLIMSPITARLVKAFINVDENYYRTVDLHDPIEIDGVRITALDANHCPGAVLFLFQLSNGTNILHTGDFRASADMEEYPEFWNMDIHSIYLDTTYLSSKYAFKSQWESVTDAVAVVQAFISRNIGARILVVCGSYLIGKEKVWAQIAERLNFKVWTEPNRRKALAAVADPLQHKRIVDDPNEAEIHVLSMNKLSYDELVLYMDQFLDRYDSLIAIRPSGWEKNSRPQYRGRINIVGVEYSEHSSYDELKRFVRFLRPQEVISTVPYGNSNQNRTPQVPPSWYLGAIRPERKSLQLSMTSFVKVGLKTPAAKRDPNKITNRIEEQDEEDDCTIVTEEVLVPDKLDDQNEDHVEEGEDDEAAHSEKGEQDEDADSDWML